MVLKSQSHDVGIEDWWRVQNAKLAIAIACSIAVESVFCNCICEFLKCHSLDAIWKKKSQDIFLPGFKLYWWTEKINRC
jgi:hypothetical protein